MTVLMVFSLIFMFLELFSKFDEDQELYSFASKMFGLVGMTWYLLSKVIG